MLAIPLIQTPSQILNVPIGTGVFQINVYQKSTGVYIDVLQSGTLLIGGVLCLDRNLIFRGSYLGFPGDLAFVDNQANNDPDYTGFGTRYQLVYLDDNDLAQVPTLSK